MDLIKFSTHYYNPFPQTHTHTHTHTHIHTHKQLGMGECIGFPLLASNQGCKKQNTFNVSYVYVMELLHIYVVTFFPISDTFSLLVLWQHCVWSHSLILSELYLKAKLGYKFLPIFLQVLSMLLSFRHYPK